MVLFYLPGGIPIYAFSMFAALGSTLGLAWVVLRAPEKERLVRLDAGIAALLGAVLGGRAGYVLINWTYFGAHSGQILQIHLGGLSWPGALIGGALFVGLFAWWARRPVAPLADALLPLALLVAIAAWLGCWMDGCAYGWPAEAWWVLPGPDEWGQAEPRFPLQLVGAAICLALLWLLERLSGKRKLPPGLLSGLGLFGISVCSFGLSFLRADVALVWRGLRLDAWAGLGICVLALAGVAVILLYKPKGH